MEAFPGQWLRYAIQAGITFKGPITFAQGCCTGGCAGLGYVPVPFAATMSPWRQLYDHAESINPSENGWHIIQCPDCHGAGREWFAMNKSELLKYKPRLRID